jgi:homoaconitase/3-isopropylmalate dehydratase large subunit
VEFDLTIICYLFSLNHISFTDITSPILCPDCCCRWAYATTGVFASGVAASEVEPVVATEGLRLDGVTILAPSMKRFSVTTRMTICDLELYKFSVNDMHG